MENLTLAQVPVTAVAWLRDQLTSADPWGSTLVRGGDENTVLLDVVELTEDGTFLVRLEEVTETDEDETYELVREFEVSLDDENDLRLLAVAYVVCGGDMADFDGPSYF